MRKHTKRIILMFIFSLFVFGAVFTSCGGGGGGDGGGSGRPVLNVSALSSENGDYVISPIQGTTDKGTMVGISVNPPTMYGLNVMLTDDRKTLRLRPLGDSPVHDRNAVCSTCHAPIDDVRAGATYFTACFPNEATDNTSDMLCATADEDDEFTEFDAKYTRFAVYHDDPNIEIRGLENLSYLRFIIEGDPNGGDNGSGGGGGGDNGSGGGGSGGGGGGDNETPKDQQLPITSVTVDKNMSNTTEANPAKISFVIDTSYYPGEAPTALLTNKKDSPAGTDDITMAITGSPTRFTATAECYESADSVMKCRTPGSANGYSTGTFPIPLTSNNISITIDDITRAPTNGSELDGPGGMFDNANKELPVVSINVAPDLSTTSVSGPYATVKIVIDATDYPSTAGYGNIGALLTNGTDNVTMKTVLDPSNANYRIATAECYKDNETAMYCRSPDGSPDSFAPNIFPIPLTSANFLLGTHADADGTPQGNIQLPANGDDLDDMLKNGTPNLPGIPTTPVQPPAKTPVIINAVSGAIIPMQTRYTPTTPVKTTVATSTAVGDIFTATINSSPISVTRDDGTNNINISCVITGVDNKTAAVTQLTCDGTTPISVSSPIKLGLTVTAGSTHIYDNASFTTTLATANPAAMMTVTEYTESGAIPMNNILGEESALLAFMVNVKYTKPGSPINCVMYDVTTPGLLGLGGVISTVDGLVTGLLGSKPTFTFPAVTPNNEEMIMLKTTCTYNPGVLGILASSLECTGVQTPNNTFDLLSVLNNNSFTMVCTDGVIAGASQTFELATGLLGGN